MEDLPATDPIPQTWQESTKDTVNGLMAWIKENQGDIIQGYQFIQSIIKNRGEVPSFASDGSPAGDPLTPINE